jgi:hypothetical protein
MIEKKEEIIGVKLRQGNISLVLDSYDDLFSDFDPRSYSEKALSDDFLAECKRAARHQEGVTELRLLLPSNRRKIHEEAIIKKRLKSHFLKHYQEEKRIIGRIRREGFLWFLIGSVILTMSTLLYEYKADFYAQLKFLWDFLFIISQPAGWFTFWEGLGKVFIVAREEIPNYEFYKKMSEANIYFLNY